jgi:signal transduction histidine kinase
VIFAGTKELTQSINQCNNFLLEDRINSEYLKLIQYWAPYIFKKEEKPISGRELRKIATKIYENLIVISKISDDECKEIALKLAQLDLGNRTNEFINLMHSIEKPSEFLNYMLELKKIKQLENSIDFAVENTKKVVTEMNILAENQTSFQQFEIFNLHKLVSSLIEQNTELLENQIETDISLDKSKFIRFERISFIQNISIIIQNAIEALENNNSEKRICISNYTVSDFEVICIENNGPKIPDNLINVIFNRFYTTKNKALHRGLGLSTVKTILEGFGGKIVVKSTDESTIFEMYIRIENKIAS